MKVIIFGSTGAVGRCLIEILTKEEPTWEIFAVTRSETTDKFEMFQNVTVLKGDPNSKEETMRLSADKDIIYSCVGFPRYEAKYWAKHWPIIVENLLAASSQTDNQKLVFCDNLYAYGATTNISPTSPIVPKSWKSKPGVRAHLREQFARRMQEKPSSITVVGGADFFGPHVTNMSFLGDTFTKAIVEGKPAPICIGSCSVVHDFCYTPDFARALYVASIEPKAEGHFWICPHAIHGKTLQEIATDVASMSGSNNGKVTAYPGWSVRLLSPFMDFMREMVEMLPFWSNDYTVNDSEFCNTFGVKATAYREALKTYIEMYQQRA